MIRFLILFSLALCCFFLYKILNPSVSDPGDALFPVQEQGRWGFIDQTGKVVIPIKFRGVGHFVAGMAPARMAGTWGYINTKGEFVIPPAFDYAADFCEGLARTWREGKVMYIDTAGHYPWSLDKTLLQADNFKNGKSEVTVDVSGEGQKYFLYKSGQLVQDTIPECQEGYYIIERKNKPKNGAWVPSDYSVFDSTGKTVVPFGQYASIEPFKNGFASVTVLKVKGKWEYTNPMGYINRKGELAFMLPLGSEPAFEAYFSEGMLAVTSASDGGNINSSSDNFISWYDTTGKLLFEKRDDHDAYPFHHGRTFTGKIRNWYLMDRQGNPLGSNRFEWVIDDDWSDGMAIVAEKNYSEDIFQADRYGAIDSMGNYVIAPQFNEVLDIGFQSEGLLVAMKEPIRAEHRAPEYKPIKQKWGLIDKKGKYIFRPKLTFVDQAGFKNGLLYAEIDSLYGYVNREGDFVWKAIKPQKEASFGPLNVDYMLRAYCYAFNEGVHPALSGNFERNYARPGAKSMDFPANEFGIVVWTSEPSTFMHDYSGFRAYLFNTGVDTIQIDVQDNRLYCTIQALDKKGIWRDIEYCPNSWCGNSYYQVYLDPDAYWQFTLPVYEGDFATSLRVQFRQNKNHVIYSNIFAGSINPGQFWRKQGYVPNGFMDPYVE